MKTEKTIITVMALAVLMILAPSCKRNSVEEPSPFGPSTYAVILSVSASPNVIFAGSSREATTITATLKRYDGMAISGKTVHLDIRNSQGSKIPVGYFEGNLSTSTQVTDQNGMVYATYLGPYAQELLTDFTVYITAVVAWEGEVFISEFAPVYIIRETASMSFVIYADPNTLLASDSRPTSKITAYLNTGDGIPASNREVFFWIQEIPSFFMTGGFFEGNKTVGSARTDENGVATITYYGPTKYEIGGSGCINIYAQPDISALVSEIEDPDYLYALVEIRILKDQ